MAVSSARCLNPAAPPYVPVASAPAPAKLCSPAPSSLPLGFPLPPQCLQPPPRLPPSCGLSVPPLPWAQVAPPLPCQVTVYCSPKYCHMTTYCIPSPPPPPALLATRCSITEVVDDASGKSPKAEAENRPSPRSVLPPRRSHGSVSPPAPKPRAAAAPRPMSSKPAFDPSSTKTSLMICNIPNNFSKRRVMEILDQHCVGENDKLRFRGRKFVMSEYDFLYVPIDFRTRYNKGYAFVNMTTATAARRLHKFLHGYSWAATGSRKVCEVVHATIQGASALARHFSDSKFPCGNGNEEFLPVRFGPPRNGPRPTAERVVGRAVVRRSRW